MEVVGHEEWHPGYRGVGRIQPLAGPDIRTYRRGRQSEQSFVVQRVHQRLLHLTEATHLVVVGHAKARRHRPLHPWRIVIAQILANALQLMPHFEAQRLQPFCLADAGQLQQLRRIDRAGADDDLARGTEASCVWPLTL